MNWEMIILIFLLWRIGSKLELVEDKIFDLTSEIRASNGDDEIDEDAAKRKYVAIL